MMSLLISTFGLTGSLLEYSGEWLAFLGSALVKVTLVLAAAYALSLALRRASAAARHLIWASAICSMLTLPLLSLLVPAWQVSYLPNIPAPYASKAGTKEIPTVAPRAPGLKSSTAPQPQSPTPSPAHRGLYSWALLIWGTGMVIVYTRLFVGLLRLRRTARKSNRIEQSEWNDLLSELAGRVGVSRTVTLLKSDHASMPVTWGIRRPVLLLPKNADEWSIERRRIVLLHELAHVARQDWLTQLLAQIACGVYWFHPLAWIAAGHLRKESERACDDQVLSLGTNPSDYGGHLVELARSLRSPKQTWSVAIAMARSSDLERRVMAVLDPKRYRQALARSTVKLAALAVVVVILPLAALQGSAEKKTGTISGKVYDPSGAVIPAAVVTVTNLETQDKLTLRTSDAGEFEFQAIRAGSYLIEVSAAKFGSFQGRSQPLNAGKNWRMDVILQPGLVVESVVVTAESPQTGPATPRRVPRRIRVGGHVLAAKLLSLEKPNYPEDAKKLGKEGTVFLNAVISGEGKVVSLRVVNEPDPQLAKAALDAVKLWRYRPTLLNGEPVEVISTIKVNFRLEK